jgi:hypothetical protein
MKNPFELTGNSALIDWFDEITVGPSGIYVVGGLSGSAVWTIKHRCLEGLRWHGYPCIACRGADPHMMAEAVRQAESGVIVLLALKISEPEEARKRFKHDGLGEAFGLVRGVLIQTLVPLGEKIQLQAAYTKNAE